MFGLYFVVAFDVLLAVASPIDISVDGPKVTPLMLNDQPVTAPPSAGPVQTPLVVGHGETIIYRRESKYECDNAFGMKLRSVLVKATGQNETWRRLLRTANTSEIEETIQMNLVIFDETFFSETEFYHQQCALCARYGAAYPCCIRERAYWQTHIMKARDEFVRRVCLKAAEYRIPPESCAYPARVYDTSSDMVTLLKCEAKCAGAYKNEGLCGVNSTWPGIDEMSLSTAATTEIFPDPTPDWIFGETRTEAATPSTIESVSVGS